MARGSFRAGLSADLASAPDAGFSAGSGRAALSVGMRPDTVRHLRMGADPVALRLLDFAHRYAVLMRQKPAVTKKVAQAKRVVKTGPAPSANRSAAVVTKAHDRLRKTGSVEDAIALEMGRIDDQERRARRR